MSNKLRILGSWSQCMRKNERGLPMNRLVAQAFQPAGLPDFRVRWTTNGRLESRPNPQARKPALRTRHGSSSQCIRTTKGGMNIKSVTARALEYPEPHDHGKLRYITLARIETEDGAVGWGECISQFPE